MTLDDALLQALVYLLGTAAFVALGVWLLMPMVASRMREMARQITEEHEARKALEKRGQ